MLLFWKMCSELVDVPDLIPIQEPVNDENKEESTPWKFCTSKNWPRSEVAFSVEAFVSLLLLTIFLAKLASFDFDCDDKPFWTSIRWEAVGCPIPNPEAWKNKLCNKKGFYVRCWTFRIGRNKDGFFQCWLSRRFISCFKNYFVSFANFNFCLGKWEEIKFRSYQMP